MNAEQVEIDANKRRSDPSWLGGVNKIIAVLPPGSQLDDGGTVEGTLEALRVILIAIDPTDPPSFTMAQKGKNASSN